MLGGISGHGTEKNVSSMSISHSIALYIHTYNTWLVSLADNYIFSPDNSVFISLSLPLISSIFLSPSSPLWWQCPAVMRQGQRCEIHLNTDATLLRPILCLRSTLSCTPHPNWWMDRSPSNIYYLPCIVHSMDYTSTGTMFWVYREKNNLFFIVENCGGSCSCCAWQSLCVCRSQVHLHLKCFHPSLWHTKGPAISMF